MKKMTVFLAALLLSASTYASLGEQLEGEGKIYQNPSITIVRKTFSPDKGMKRHHHPNSQVVLTVINGKAVFTLDNDDGKNREEHTLTAGEVLTFNGENYITGKFEEPTMVVVTLVEDEQK
ncbi:hypothetical protein [Suttonella ornithocola]|uniref:Cupin domain n=1 Tax=Suttonella ornithocola TaxID=279832 RepID=A0A380MKM4_9GAMM|nr:hypothetical protein [Suttonella ornithocola]SUO93195.1 Uncharacterised protein [Suttonella ornithocola]